MGKLNQIESLLWVLWKDPLGILWTNIWVFCERTHRFLSQYTQWPLWWVLSQRAHCFTHWIFGGQIDGFFHKIPTMDPLGTVGANLTRTHNVPTMYPLGKWPLIPSEIGLTCIPRVFEWHSARDCTLMRRCHDISIEVLIVTERKIVQEHW